MKSIITSYWSYALNTVPGLGQAFTDFVSKAANLPRTDFMGCIDHPMGDASNHPDLLLQCKDWHLLFEHKVGASLGPSQLQRYLSLATSRNWKLALMAAEPVAVEDDVLLSEMFVPTVEPDSDSSLPMERSSALAPECGAPPRDGVCRVP